MSDITICDCEEHWIEIKNKKGKLYLLSSKGRLYSFSRKKFIGKLSKNKYVYGTRSLFSDCMHRLVYRYFYQINIEEVNENNHIDHINTIKNHNCICNLRCCSRTENNNNILTKQKISNSLIGNKRAKGNKGKIPWNKGIKIVN